MTTPTRVLRRRAEGGDKDAMFELSGRYYFGADARRNKRKAFHWHLKAAEAGHAFAMFYVGIAYEMGDTVAKDAAKAKEWFEKASEAGHTGTMNYLGSMCSRGRGVPVDQVKAKEYYEKAANAGDSLGMTNLAIMYHEGRGTVRDDARAMEWLKRAAKAKNPHAMSIIGIFYDTGDGVPVDKKNAIKWWKKAARAGDRASASLLAAMYYVGDGLPRSDSKAVKWWKLAAERWDADALYQLGSAYSHGIGVSVDHIAARNLYLQGAGLGNPEAMFAAGECFYKGTGGPRNRRMAGRLWRRASATGHVGGTIAARVLGLRSCRKRVSSFLSLHMAVHGLRAYQHHVRGIQQVCHFTTLDTIRSMLPLDYETGRGIPDHNLLRMYNVGYVNDPTEGKVLVRFSRQRGGLIHEFLGDEEHNPHDSLVYVASFTEENDRLDLWRAYGHDGTGCCIAIPMTQFRDIPRDLSAGLLSRSDQTRMTDSLMSGIGNNPSSAPGHIQAAPDNHGAPQSSRLTSPAMNLYRVCYSSAEKQLALEKLGDALRDIRMIGTRRSQGDLRQKVNSLVRIILADILFLYKDAEYRTEREIRMASVHLPDDPQIRTDEGKRDEGIAHCYVPTRPFLFTSPGYEVIIGPRVKDKYATRLEIEHRLERSGFANNVRVSESTIEYR